NYDQNMSGFIAGMDRTGELNNGDLMIGALGGYITSNTDFKKTDTKTSISGGTAGIYATYLNGGLFVDGVFKADFVDVNHNTGFGTADSRGKTSAITMGGILDTGYRFQGENYAYVEPLATIAYSSTDVDDMKLLGNTVSFADGDNLLGRLGLRAGTSVATGNGSYVEPFVVANVWNQFDGDNAATLSSAGAGDVKVKDDTSGASYQVGGGIELRNTNGFSAFLKGHYQWGNGLEGGSGRGGVRVNW
ncbi:MAG: autotransporter domain-containing protein, partial [bacterium]|nr:autotransporter domain-containing protein [bacterium]